MEQKVHVLKFDGTNIGSNERFRQPTNTIASTAALPHEGPPVVIIFARSGVSDSLLRSLLLLAAGVEDVGVQAKALHAAGVLNFFQNSSTLAEALCQECPAGLRECGDTRGMATMTNAHLTKPLEPSPVVVRTLPAYPAGLTAREVEVLRLVAQGMTDVQVAQHLVISPRTVNWHLTSIYSKIGVCSRSGATRYAIEQNLV